jgi:prevent-host-death family protein
MKTVNIHDAKTNLSKLIDRAVTEGEVFIIAKAGKPLVKVTPLDRPEGVQRRVGFMRGRITLPADFKAIGRDDIAAMFEGEP